MPLSSHELSLPRCATEDLDVLPGSDSVIAQGWRPLENLNIRHGFACAQRDHTTTVGCRPRSTAKVAHRAGPTTEHVPRAGRKPARESFYPLAVSELDTVRSSAAAARTGCPPAGSRVGHDVLAAVGAAAGSARIGPRSLG